MPKIEVYETSFYELLGERIEIETLEEVFQAAKAELDDHDPEEGLLKVELNDTNRPDLWSTAGLARALRMHRTGKAPQYNFFSSAEDTQDAGTRVVRVDGSLRDIRPYIAAFVAVGKPLSEPDLKDIIQTQEKLCWNYGQKRKAIAMGYYRSDLVKYPVVYRAADPVETRFVPLGSVEEMNLVEILEKHPKGMDFAFTLEGFDRYPFLEDNAGEVLSFPPIINSAHLGAVEVGDSNLFVELTGTDMSSLLVATSIAACDMADMGFTIQPVRIEYPYETPLGRTVVTPHYFQSPQTIDAKEAGRLLGEEMAAEDIASLLTSRGQDARASGGSVVVRCPEYRNDFLHPVDLVEEIMIARGMESFEPVMPEEYTIGRISEAEAYCRRIRDLMVGLGYQEMIFNYLGSRADIVEKMRVDGSEVIEIANPMTENYALVRDSILPDLLRSTSVSGHAVYPHRIFEIGKVAFLDPSQNYGSRTRNTLALLLADGEAGFNDLTPVVAALCYFLVCPYELRPVSDPRFIEGRTAEILSEGHRVGILGEIHPEVLENWGVTMPCACAEIDLDLLRGETTG
jgi:phenylalanyl-tRNA synthetase beta chain